MSLFPLLSLLPADIRKNYLLQFLSITSFRRLCITSKEYHQLWFRDTIWYNYLLRDFQYDRRTFPRTMYRLLFIDPNNLYIDYPYRMIKAMHPKILEVQSLFDSFPVDLLANSDSVWYKYHVTPETVIIISVEHGPCSTVSLKFKRHTWIMWSLLKQEAIFDVTIPFSLFSIVEIKEMVHRYVNHTKRLQNEEDVKEHLAPIIKRYEMERVITVYHYDGVELRSKIYPDYKIDIIRL